MVAGQPDAPAHAGARPRIMLRRMKSRSSTATIRRHGAEPHAVEGRPVQKVSQTTSSAMTDTSADRAADWTACPSPSFIHLRSASASELMPSWRKTWRADVPFFPSYAANMDSSRTEGGRAVQPAASLPLLDRC